MCSMKKFLPIILLAFASSVPAGAQLNGNGYYRVQNYATERYVYLTDDKGHVDASTTSVDAMAIQLWKDFNKASSDPSTILYIKSMGGNEYDIEAQGTGINKIIDHNLKIRTNSDGTYYAYGQQSGMAKYLGDANSSDAPEGTMSSEATGDRRKWWIKPINDNDNFFGINPTLAINGKYYKPMYASFPMSAASNGVKIRIVTKYGYGMAVATDVNGTIPAGTACFIECASSSPANNKMNIGGTGSTITNNQLSGVYFENYMKTHLNLTPYDPNTMRVLGKLSDGSLGFVVAQLEYLPANESYLRVPAGAPAEIRIVSQEEYDRVVGSHPSSVTVTPSEAKMYVGSELQLSAAIAPDNASDKRLTWKSNNISVVTVDANGKLKAQGKGNAIVEVSTINGRTAQCKVSVNPTYPESITVTPATYKFYVGDKYKLQAVIAPEDVQYKSIIWKSSDESIVSVDASGNISALKVGDATITASTADGKTASTSVAVKPVYPTTVTLNFNESYISANSSCQLIATISPTDVKDTSILWSSASERIAVVDNTGKVTGCNTGTTVITAASPGGAKATCTINVTSPLPESLTIDLEYLIMEVGDSRYLIAEIQPENAVSALTWTSSNSSIVSVNSIGQITAVAEGEATVTATTSNGISAVCNITVKPKGIPATSVQVIPSSISLNVGEVVSLSAQVLPENVTNPFVTWSSNNNKVAKVDKDGNVTAIAHGTALIYAQCGSVRGSCLVTVTVVPVSEIILDKDRMELKVGEQASLDVTILPENASDKRIKWSSDNVNIATVDLNGTISVHNVGNSNIIAEAMDGSGVKAVCLLVATSGVTSTIIDLTKPVNVYHLDGTLIIKDATGDDIKSLTPGLYIIDNHKVLVK